MGETTKAVATTTEKKVSKNKFDWTTKQIQLIKNTVAKGATNDELKLFLYTCNRVGLDPLAKQIHFVKRGGSMTVQTGIDGYRAIGERSGTLAGIDDAIYDDPTETAKNPKKATVTVYRMIAGIKVTFTASARWSEYAPDGKQAFMWTKMPYLMLGKCAEALALRKAFPNDLTGIYTNEEMAQADNRVITPPKNNQPTTPPPAKPDMGLMKEIKAMIVEIDPTVNSAAKMKEYIEKELKIDLKPQNLRKISDIMLEKIGEKTDKEKDFVQDMEEEIEKIDSKKPISSAGKKMQEGMKKGGRKQ